MSIDPWRVAYLREAGAFLGNVASEDIEQVGENPGAFRQDYRVLDEFEAIKSDSQISGS